MRGLLLLNAGSRVSGAERVLIDLAALAREQGRPVTVACPDGPLAAQLPPGTAHLRVPALGLSDGPRPLPRPLAVADLVRRSTLAARVLRRSVLPGTDVVVNATPALLAARLGLPAGSATWLVHDTVHRRDQAWTVQAGRRVLRHAVAVSESAAAPLRRLGLTVRVAPNGVPLPAARPARPLGRPPVVGMLALLTPWKGHAVLLEAVARLPGVQLELAGGAFPGDAAHVAALEQRAARPDLVGRVRFLGHVRADDALARWDVAVSASTSPEAGPLGVLEAMARGVPVVGTDLGGTRDYLGATGLLVPPGDAGALAAALQRLLGQPSLRSSLSAAAREAVECRHDQRRTLPTLLAELVAR